MFELKLARSQIKESKKELSGRTFYRHNDQAFGLRLVFFALANIPPTFLLALYKSYVIVQQWSLLNYQILKKKICL